MHLCSQGGKSRERGRNNTLGTDLLSRTSLPRVPCAPWAAISPGGQAHHAHTSIMLLALQLLLVSYSVPTNMSTAAKPVLYFTRFFQVLNWTKLTLCCRTAQTTEVMSVYDSPHASPAQQLDKEIYWKKSPCHCRLLAGLCKPSTCLFLVSQLLHCS